jgi:hypothetical protein
VIVKTCGSFLFDAPGSVRERQVDLAEEVARVARRFRVPVANGADDVAVTGKATVPAAVTNTTIVRLPAAIWSIPGLGSPTVAGGGST